jgi:MinD superfamily P-loop ATPase
VEVCTAAILKGPAVYGRIASEAALWLADHGYKDIDEVKGLYLEKYKLGEEVDTRITRTARVDTERCKACSLCEVVCQFDALRAPHKQIAEVDQAACTACGLCVSVCPFGALALVPFDSAD